MNMECERNKMKIVDFIADLQSADKDVIFDVTERIINRFDSYDKIDEHEFIMLMNAIILKCISNKIQEDRAVFEHLLDALEMGVGRSGTAQVNFEPLIEIFNNKEYTDIFDRLVIILGFSLQPKYVEYLSKINTNDSVLKKEINEAIFELNNSKY